MKALFNILLIGLFLFFLNCQDDDVCVGDSDPYLISKIRSFGTTDSLLVDTLWIVYSLENNIKDTLKLQQVDSFRIPLPINGSPFEFELIRSVQLPADKVLLNYTPGQEFESKACGLKRTFLNTNYTFENQVMVQELEPNVNSITNNNEVHLFIYY